MKIFLVFPVPTFSNFDQLKTILPERADMYILHKTLLSKKSNIQTFYLEFSKHSVYFYLISGLSNPNTATNLFNTYLALIEVFQTTTISAKHHDKNL